MAQNNAPALHATVAARSSLCLLAGLAYAAEMAGDEEVATRLWCDRARYVCFDLVEQVATMVLANEIEGTQAVGRALRREARRLDFMPSGKAQVLLGALLETLASAVETRTLTPRSLLVAACAVHALGAVREIVTNWCSQPGAAADAAVEAEAVWAATASEPEAQTTQVLGALFGDRDTLDRVTACRTAAQAGDLVHLWWIARWLSARGELKGLVEGINPGDVPRTDVH